MYDQDYPQPPPTHCLYLKEGGREVGEGEEGGRGGGRGREGEGEGGRGGGREGEGEGGRGIKVVIMMLPLTFGKVGVMIEFPAIKCS